MTEQGTTQAIERKRILKVTAVAGIAGALVGALGLAIYNSSAPPSELSVYVAPSSHRLVELVGCSVDRGGDGVAAGYVSLDAVAYQGTIKVSVDFTADGQVVQQSYGYVDTTDPALDDANPGVTQPFSVVGRPSLTTTTPTPTGCRVSASISYGSTLKPVSNAARNRRLAGAEAQVGSGSSP